MKKRRPIRNRRGRFWTDRIGLWTRRGGPAFENDDGSKHWYLDGRPCYIEDAANECWYFIGRDYQVVFDEGKLGFRFPGYGS